MAAKPDHSARFRPFPFLANPHLQTIVGFLWKGGAFPHPSREVHVELGDGDRLALHDSIPATWKPGMPTALLIHGLGGNSQSGYVRRVGARLVGHGVRVVRIDLRGTGAGEAIAQKFYHAGRSEDVRAALREMHAWAPESPLWLIGFSLGGNMALKLGGEASDSEVPGLARIVAVAPPVDIVGCSKLISQPRNRHYDRFFARRLLYLAQVRQRHYPDPPLPEFPQALSLRIFDDLFTAPRCGFVDALDYYRQASSLPLVPRIPVPTLIISARDDPLVAVGPLEQLQCPPHIRIEIQEHGGHLGFLGAAGDGGARWVEKRIVDWLVQPQTDRK